MKITFVINGYKDELNLLDREMLCVTSLRKIKSKHDVSLINVNNSGTAYSEFETCDMAHDSKFPSVNKIMSAATEHAEEGVVLFVNLDIFVKEHLLDHITSQHDTYLGSRMDVTPLDGRALEFTPVEYSVHGFDLFGVTVDWWNKNKQLFPDMYLGRPYWDTLYYVICMEHSKCRTINDHPACIYHVKHANEWENITDEYKTHNEQQLRTVPSFSKWWQYVYGVLLKRPDKNGVKFWTPLVNEQSVADQLFKI